MEPEGAVPYSQQLAADLLSWTTWFQYIHS
jgi:hypothetical protein